MPTATDVFAKVRGHERAEQLRAAREADLLPYFRLLEAGRRRPWWRWRAPSGSCSARTTTSA